MKLKYINVITISYLMIPSLYASSIRIPALDRIRKKVDDALQCESVKLSEQIDKLRSALGTKDQLLDDAEKIMAGLHWGHQQDMIKKLLDLKKKSVTQAAQYLNDVIKTKCQTRSPLLTFAQELASEEHKLQDVFNMLLKSANVDKDRVKKLFDRHTQLCQNLQQLIEATNALMG